MKLQALLLQAFKRHIAHLLSEASPNPLSFEECGLHNQRKKASPHGHELRIVSRRLAQIKYHFAYLRTRDYRKIRAIIDSLQIGSKDDLVFGSNIIEEAEKCGLDERTYNLAKTALQYNIEKKETDKESDGKIVNYKDANSAISTLAHREDRVSSYILYRVTKKKDVCINLGACPLQRDALYQLDFQSQRDFAKKALKQRGWRDVDPLADEFANLAESRFGAEMAQLKLEYRELRKRKELLQKELLLTL